MTTSSHEPQLVQLTDDATARPLPTALPAARATVTHAIEALRAIPDAALTKAWGWKGGSEEELRYGFYRIGEAFDLAALEAADTLREAGVERGRAADLIALATEARWDLQGLLVPLSEADWDAGPGAGEWTIRQTMGHLVGSQRGYGVGTAWWIRQALPADALDLPRIPESLFDAMPTDEAEGEGTPDETRARLDGLLDQCMERLAGLPAAQLALAGRWSGFPVTVGFRIGRWSSHIREHTIQVEKTLAMLDHQPTENDRLVRLVLAAWGRAESVAYGIPAEDATDALSVLSRAADEARSVAEEIAALARA
jgi:hypothetical protein